jgi:glycosyltransferase involved in cell wall biosynthesis
MTDNSQPGTESNSDRLLEDVEMPDGPDDETLSVIVPCLNEEDTVQRTADTVFGLAPELPVDVEVFFIDDGSTDLTLDRMEEYAAEQGGCRIMSNDENLGLGRSILKAYERIPPDHWATVLPGDNELIFASVKNFLAIRDDYELILGYLKNSVIRPFARRFASESFTALANFLYGFSFRYFNGMKLYKIGVFQGIEVEADGHAFNPELIAKAVLRDPDLRIGEAPF